MLLIHIMKESEKLPIFVFIDLCEHVWKHLYIYTYIVIQMYIYIPIYVCVFFFIVENGCGATVFGSNHQIVSPNYPLPPPDNLDCFYSFTVPAPYHAYLNFMCKTRICWPFHLCILLFICVFRMTSLGHRLWCDGGKGSWYIPKGQSQKKLIC